MLCCIFIILGISLPIYTGVFNSAWFDVNEKFGVPFRLRFFYNSTLKFDSRDNAHCVKLRLWLHVGKPTDDWMDGWFGWFGFTDASSSRHNSTHSHVSTDIRKFCPHPITDTKLTLILMLALMPTLTVLSLLNGCQSTRHMTNSSHGRFVTVISSHSQLVTCHLVTVQQWTQLNLTQRASMDAGVKTPQCPHLSSQYGISIL